MILQSEPEYKRYKKQLRKLQPARDGERLKEGVVFQGSLGQHKAHLFCPTLTGATFDSDSDSVFFVLHYPQVF